MKLNIKMMMQMQIKSMAKTQKNTIQIKINKMTIRANKKNITTKRNTTNNTMKINNNRVITVTRGNKTPMARIKDKKEIIKINKIT